MTTAWGAPEWITAIMFGLGLTWIASKLLGLIWCVIRAPFVAVFYHFVDDRVFAGVNRLEGEEPEPPHNQTSSHVNRPSSALAVRPHTHHVEPSEPVQNEPGREPDSLRNLSRLEEIVWLATLRNDDGNYRHSANEITKFIGGTAADVKATIATVRNKKDPLARPSPRLVRDPVKGWN